MVMQNGKGLNLKMEPLHINLPGEVSKVFKPATSTDPLTKGPGETEPAGR